MRRMMTVLVLAAALAGCGDDGDDETLACSEMWGGAMVVEEGANDAPCDDQGELVFVTQIFYECNDGRTLAWNEYGWGYYGELWTAHSGDVLEAPADELEACTA